MRQIQPSNPPGPPSNAWVHLVEMRGEFSFNEKIGEWGCYAPTGETTPQGYALRCKAHSRDPETAINGCHTQWVQRGRHQWPGVRHG